MIKLTKYEVDDDGYITIPPEVLEALGWQEGDEIEITETEDGQGISMRKVE